MIDRIQRFFDGRNVPFKVQDTFRSGAYDVVEFESIRAERAYKALSDLSSFLMMPAVPVRRAGELPAIAIKREAQVVDPRPPKDGEIFAGTGAVEDRYISVPGAPHMLIAGATGSGKSVFVHTILASLHRYFTPAQWRLLLLDPKKVEFAAYADSTLLGDIVRTDPEEISDALRHAVQYMERRFTLMQEMGWRDWKQSGMYRLLIVVDELADLRATSDSAHKHLQRIAQKGRAAGVHLLLATQRPSTDVIPGTLKANIPLRVALQTATATDSRVILDEGGAEDLQQKGEAIIARGARSIRVQTPYTRTEDIEAAVKYSIEHYAYNRGGGMYLPLNAEKPVEHTPHPDNT